MLDIILLVVVWLIIIAVVSYVIANLYWICWGDRSEYDKLPDDDDDIKDYDEEPDHF